MTFRKAENYLYEPLAGVRELSTLRKALHTYQCLRRFIGLLSLSMLLLVQAGSAQEAPLVLFDEDDAVGADYRDASSGAALGDDVLHLAGPNGDKMPVHDAHAFRGATSGLLAYRHRTGTWTLAVAADGAQPQDWTAYDSLVVYLNGPAPVAAPELPLLSLEDQDGQTTAALPLDLGGRIGFNASRSGFVEGSPTDARLSVDYIDVLSSELTRPGYPEDLLITFADAPRDTSTVGIGVPAVPAHFTVETEAGGLRLAFRFRDLDSDGTLSTADEYIEVLTPEPDDTTRLRPTWRIELTSPTPSVLPGAGDVYRLAVDNGGIDGDPDTWQRVSVAFDAFGPLGSFDLGAVQAVRFSNGTAPNAALRTLWFDYVAAVGAAGSGEAPAPPDGITAQAGDRSVVLRWQAVPGAVGYHVYRRTSSDVPFERLTATLARTPDFADLTAANGTSYTYILRSVGADGAMSADGPPVVATPQAGLGDAFLDLLQRKAFDYFWSEANPSNGLIKDRSTATSPASIAAVGFGLSVITVGIDRGWITRAQGAERVLATLAFFWNSPQSATDPTATGYRGFYYHFLDMQTGQRAWNSELSTIDTALLLGGVLHAGKYFDGAGDDEAQIRALADSIYERVDWAWASPRAPYISHGWRPETGFIEHDWRGYNEAMILYLLALGSPTHPVPPDAWDAWTSGYQWQTHYGYSYVVFPPLFGHQYSHVWIDFRGIQDAYMRERGIDYFENSRRATLAQRAYAAANPGNWEGYGPESWGLTASDVPTGYRARGAPPAQNDDGTITPTAPGGSVPFAPEETIATLRTLYQTYRDPLWGPYGFQDAINPEEDWVAQDVLGIDQGPILLMIENHRTGQIWDVFMTHEAIQRGLDRAGFEPVDTAAEPPIEQPAELTLTDIYPNPFSQTATIHYMLPRTGPVALEVYDVLGRRVRTLVDAVQPAGAHTVLFDAAGLASGVYVYVLRSEKHVATGRLVLQR